MFDTFEGNKQYQVSGAFFTVTSLGFGERERPKP